MEKLPALLGALVIAIIILVLGSVFSEPIAGWLARRFKWSNGAEDTLLWGLLILTAFSFGLLVMYLLLRP
jgi:MFS-type transporter involved in bile tolerance (Atg22 family)